MASKSIGWREFRAILAKSKKSRIAKNRQESLGKDCQTKIAK
ncbi:hypothetical protein [Helicobacter macacae]|nr:hypothetical protein [Helicobacter macacae]